MLQQNAGMKRDRCLSMDFSLHHCRRARAGEATRLCDRAIEAGASASAGKEGANGNRGSGGGIPTMWREGVTRVRRVR